MKHTCSLACVPSIAHPIHRPSHSSPVAARIGGVIVAYSLGRPASHLPSVTACTGGVIVAAVVVIPVLPAAASIGGSAAASSSKKVFFKYIKGEHTYFSRRSASHSPFVAAWFGGLLEVLKWAKKDIKWNIHETYIFLETICVSFVVRRCLIWWSTRSSKMSEKSFKNI